VKAERPSRTAHFVAHGRALADAGLSHVPDFHDPTARVFLNEKGKRSLAKTEHAAREGKRGIGMMRATLAGIAGRSAPGSTLIVNYHTVHRRLFARLMFRLIGEPQISAWSRLEMAADLRSAGFVVREDSGMADWNVRFAHGRARVERGSYMRIAIARA
jgi:O-methyltransferase involved in polyketide biosynthesis